MKKIFTLGIALFTAMISFADYAPSRLIVTSKGNADIKITIDENSRYQMIRYGDAIFDDLTPGFHSVKVYQSNTQRGWFGNKRTSYKLIYTASINVKPRYELNIAINNRGRASVTEERINGRNDDRWDNGRDHRNDRDRRDDRYGRDNNDRYDDDRYGRDRDNAPRLMTDQEFYAATKMVQRESFDDNRLVVAKHLADVNSLTSAQVKEITRFFSFDNNKLEFAKYAYRVTVDKNKYDDVADAFSFSTTRQQLNDYIRNYR